MLLKKDSSGPEVKKLQESLNALGYDVGLADGKYGDKTAAGVLAFQLDYADLVDDSIAGPLTQDRIAQTLAAANVVPIVQCDVETWTAWERLAHLVTSSPVRYGPGRGLWVRDKFIITHGPGGLGRKSWVSMAGESYPSFHCSSWTNFFLGWLLRRNELYTHAGNIPDLSTKLLTADASLHAQPDASPYRGYGDEVSPIIPDGSAVQRHGVANVVDMRELYARRSTMPTFVLCSQSTKSSLGKWKWWHHTVLFTFRDGLMRRYAADGYRDAHKGYSAQPMRETEITDKNVASYDNIVYRAHGVITLDGSYGDKNRPIASVELEA